MHMLPEDIQRADGYSGLWDQEAGVALRAGDDLAGSWVPATGDRGRL